jgi:hypothetical protein
MAPRAPRLGLLLVALAAVFLALWQLQVRIDARQAELRGDGGEVLLTSPKLIRAMSLEYAPLVADVYWTRAVQYYGEMRLRGGSQFKQLWPLLDITTTLDPQLLVAYRFGSTFLSEPAGRGAGRPDLGVQLVERGIRANPGYWRFYEDLGFIYYFDMRDYAKAAAAFLKGSQQPHAEVWMRALAARVAERGESPEISSFLWNELYRSATNPLIKKNALTHLELLRAEMDCQQLDKLADEYQKRFGRRPADVRELIGAGLLPAAPVDPAGFPYVLGSGGKAQMNPASPLFREKQHYEKPL